jgi:DNA-directed RNA polymerase specialized sigma subunit
MVTNITPTLKDDVVSGSGSKDKLGDAVAKIVDLQDEINRAIDEFVEKKNEVCAIIDSLQNPDYVALLHKRYVEYLTWEQIACDMHVSYRHVTRMHGRALQAIERVMKEKDVPQCP